MQLYMGKELVVVTWCNLKQVKNKHFSRVNQLMEHENVFTSRNKSKGFFSFVPIAFRIFISACTVWSRTRGIFLRLDLVAKGRAHNPSHHRESDHKSYNCLGVVEWRPHTSHITTASHSWHCQCMSLVLCPYVWFGFSGYMENDFLMHVLGLCINHDSSKHTSVVKAKTSYLTFS